MSYCLRSKGFVFWIFTSSSWDYRALFPKLNGSCIYVQYFLFSIHKCNFRHLAVSDTCSVKQQGIYKHPTWRMLLCLEYSFVNSTAIHYWKPGETAPCKHEVQSNLSLLLSTKDCGLAATTARKHPTALWCILITELWIWAILETLQSHSLILQTATYQG